MNIVYLPIPNRNMINIGAKMSYEISYLHLIEHFT